MKSRGPQNCFLVHRKGFLIYNEINGVSSLSFLIYRIFSNKHWASNKRRPLVSVAFLDIHIEISASF